RIARPPPFLVLSSFSRIRPPPRSPLFPYTTLFRSKNRPNSRAVISSGVREFEQLRELVRECGPIDEHPHTECCVLGLLTKLRREDRKSTRLNSSHVKISYAVFCLKKKKNNNTNIRL